LYIDAALRGLPSVTAHGVEHHAGHGLTATEDEHAADLLLLDEPGQALELLAVGRDVARLEGRREQLPHLLVERHGGKRLRHPRFGGLVERPGRRRDGGPGAGEHGSCNDHGRNDNGCRESGQISHGHGRRW
jgi:hypothetical protein